MTALLVIAAGLAAFYFFIYRGFTDSQRLNFKLVAVYVSALLLLASIGMAVFSVKLAYENEQARTVAARMKLVQSYLSEGEFASLAETMQYSESYEADFEYVWERLEMYECCNRYLVYERAAQNTGEAEYVQAAAEYREQLLALCGNTEYPENNDYALYYLQRAGIEDCCVLR